LSSVIGLQRFIETTFQVARDRCTHNEIVFVCPWPGCGDETGNRGVNLDTGLTNCWRCNVGGHIFSFLRQLGYDPDTIKELAAQVPAQPFRLRLQSYRKKHQSRQVYLPEGFTFLSDDKPVGNRPHSIYYTLIEAMARRKKLTVEDLIEAKAGYTRVDTEWEAYCIFPVYSWNRLVYFQGRAYTDEEGQPNKRFPSNDQVELGASFWIYEEDVLRQEWVRRVVVVESILNVLSLRKKFRQMNVKDVAVVSTFSSTVSTRHWEKLLRGKQIEEICLLFDADATEKAWKAARRASFHHPNRVKFTIADMPFAPETKIDPNDEPDAAYAAWEKRKVYTETTGLARRLRKAGESLYA
jgi:hypothetical protein